MLKISVIKLIAIIILFFGLFAIVGRFIVTVNFLEEYVTKGEPIRSQSKMGVDIFQHQLFCFGIVLGIMGILLLVFCHYVTIFFQKKPDLWKNILLLLVVIVLLIIVGEVLLRLFFAEQIYSEYGHGPGYKKQAAATILNSLGFRDVEHSLEKPENITRIAIIGDSLTFGSGVENTENIFGMVLQQKLDKQYGKGKFEVIIFAKKGFTTTDELLVLHNTALNFSPDIIVLAFFPNDAEGPGSRMGFERLFFHHFMYPWVVGGWLYEHSFLFYLFESRTKNIVQALKLEEKSNKEYILHLYSKTNIYFEEHQKHLRYFIKLAQNKNSEIVVMNIPSLTEFNNYPFDIVTEYVRNITLSENGHFLDLLPSYAQFQPEKLKVSSLDGHLNSFGHEITAETLINFINQEFFLKNDSCNNSS